MISFFFRWFYSFNFFSFFSFFSVFWRTWLSFSLFSPKLGNFLLLSFSHEKKRQTLCASLTENTFSRVGDFPSLILGFLSFFLSVFFLLLCFKCSLVKERSFLNYIFFFCTRKLEVYWLVFFFLSTPSEMSMKYKKFFLPLSLSLSFFLCFF